MYRIVKFKDGFEVWRNNKVVFCCFDWNEYEFIMELLKNSGIEIEEVEEIDMFYRECR